MQRRKFLQNISLLSAAATLPAITYAAVEKKKNKFTIAFISDIHVKPSDVAEAGMAKALQNVNQLQPILLSMVATALWMHWLLIKKKQKHNGTSLIKLCRPKINYL